MTEKKLYALIFSTLLFIMACSSGKEATSIKEKPVRNLDTLATVGNEVISLKDFEDFYIENNGGKESVSKATDESKKQFLDLLVKYKLKVKEAFRNNYQDDPEVKKEIEDYKSSLAIPYIVEREVTEPNVKIWYDRRKKNLKVGVILLRIRNWSVAEDTLQKYNLMKSIIDSLNQGYSFSKLAIRHSQYGNTLADSGVLGYITGGDTFKEFEDATYSLSVGQVYQYPIRLQMGYIIVKLLDVEERSGGRKIAEILFHVKADSATVWQKANDVLKRVKAGEDFAKLAKEFSDEVETKDNGGFIGEYERDINLQGPRYFWNAVFALKPGQTSELVKTDMGIHILKNLGNEPLKSYESSREKILEEYKSKKYEFDYRNYINAMKSKYKYTVNVKVLNDFYSKLDTNKNTNSPNWDSLMTPEFKKASMMTMGDQSITVDNVIEMLKTKPEFRGVSFTPDGLKNSFDKISEMIALQFRAKSIDKDYPEFKNVMKKYIDGLLLFKAEQNSVWGKLVISDTALKAYFNDHRDLFKFSDRVDVSEIFLPNDSTAQVVYKLLTDTVAQIPVSKKVKKTKKQTTRMTFEEMAEKYTTREGFKEKKGRWGLLSETDNILGKRGIEYEVGYISTPFAFENGFSIIKVNAKEEPRLKTYTECGPELSSKFQEYETKRLEQIWVDSLQNIFPVKVFEDKLKLTFSPNKDK